MLKREDGRLDWQMRASEIANRVRAFQPWPGTYTDFRGARLTIWRANDSPEAAPYTASGSAPEPGTLGLLLGMGITGTAVLGSRMRRRRNLRVNV